jgi:hypothetical protein
MDEGIYYCSCGAPAVVLFETVDFGLVGWCGVAVDEPDEALQDWELEDLQAAQENSPPQT